MEVRIALAQLAPHLGQLDANLELVSSRLAEAVADGADIVVFPELALTGYLLQDLVPEVAIRADDPRLLAIGGWHKMQETYALLGTVAVAFCNRVGNEEGLTFWGGSRLLGPDGSLLAEAPLYEEALVMGVLETDDLRMQRYNLPVVGDERLELVRREVDRIIAERAGIAPPVESGADGETLLRPSAPANPGAEREVRPA